jgi:hypothetical protein
MGSFEAAMQAVVAHRPVAAAVARLLIEDVRNLGRHLVGDNLIGMLEVLAGELIAGHNRGKRLLGSVQIVSGNVRRRICVLGRRGER